MNLLQAIRQKETERTQPYPDTVDFNTLTANAEAGCAAGAFRQRAQTADAEFDFPEMTPKPGAVPKGGEIRAQPPVKSERRENLYRKMEQIGQVCHLPTEKIMPNPQQPRKHFDDAALVRLADSIRRYGILQPLAVRRIPADGTHREERYELVAGERRLRAASLLKLPDVPCIIVHADAQRSAELAMIENIQRENLNMFEQAAAISTLMETHRLTQEQIARRLSSSQSYVANKLRILRLSEAERNIVLQHNLTERHARAVLKLPDPAMRRSALEQIASRGMNVSSAEDYVEKLLHAVKTEPVRQMEYKLLRRDIRLFYNSVDRAVDTVRNAGIAIRCDRRDVSDGTELVIHIAAPYQSA